jgi:hypothetical protein
MVKVLINKTFKDRATGKERKAGRIVEMSEERVAEVLAVDPKLIKVVGSTIPKTIVEKAETEAETE